MKSLDQRNKTIRIAFDLVVYFRLEQHKSFRDFAFKWISHSIQIKDAFGLGMTSLANTSVRIRYVRFGHVAARFRPYFSLNLTFA